MKGARPVNRDELVGWMFGSPRKEALEGEGPLNTGPEVPTCTSVSSSRSRASESERASAELRCPSHPSMDPSTVHVWMAGWLADLNEWYPSSEPCETGNTQEVPTWPCLCLLLPTSSVQDALMRTYPPPMSRLWGFFSVTSQSHESPCFAVQQFLRLSLHNAKGLSYGCFCCSPPPPACPLSPHRNGPRRGRGV